MATSATTACTAGNTAAVDGSLGSCPPVAKSYPPFPHPSFIPHVVDGETPFVVRGTPLASVRLADQVCYCGALSAASSQLGHPRDAAGEVLAGVGPLASAGGSSRCGGGGGGVAWH